MAEDERQRPYPSLALLLLLLLLLLILHAQTGEGQTGEEQLLQYQWGRCDFREANTTNNSFTQNLNTVVGILKSKAKEGQMHYLASATEGSDTTKWVHGMYQCRGDLNTENCKACVDKVASYSCPSGYIYARITQLLGCYYRHERTMNSLMDVGSYGVFNSCSAEQNTNLRYQMNIDTALLGSSIESVRVLDNGSFANDTVVDSTIVDTAYALSQCLYFISSIDCGFCLAERTSRSTACNTSVSGSFYYSSCFFLYSNKPLLFSSTSSSISPSSPPPLAPSSSSYSPSESKSLPPNLISPSASDQELTSRSGRGLSVGVIAGVSVGIALAIVTLVFVFVIRKQSSNYENLNPQPLNISVADMRVATKNFDNLNLIGKGAFGKVYKGTLKDGREVAIKVISSTSSTTEKDFSNEAKLIMDVQHKNLIQLLGYGADKKQWYLVYYYLRKKQWYLVYDYLPNGSLDKHLFGESNSQFQAISLNWTVRVNIIRGIANGLKYLHEDSNKRIVHRDIKAANILLDKNLEAKIADFGLARLFPENQTHINTVVAGTPAYMAPDYLREGQVSEKVDVYSFGVLTLEIVSGRRATFRAMGTTPEIVKWAWDCYERKDTSAMVDTRISGLGQDNGWEMELMVHVALLCTQGNKERPSMSQVCHMLESQSIPDLRPSQPTWHQNPNREENSL